MALKVACRLDCGVDTRGFSALSRLVADASGRRIHESKPVTGGSAFLHESGIHCAGLMRDRATYEPFTSAEVGCVAPDFLIGRHSGSAAIEEVFHKVGRRFSPAVLASLLEKVRRFAAGKKSALKTGELLALATRLEEQG